MTLNIFKAIGDFFTDLLFIPYNYLTGMSDKEYWWASNSFNTILFVITAFLFCYWLYKLKIFKNEGTE